MPIPENPEAFVQSLRMRLRALPSSDALLIVEGVRDHRALLPFVAQSTAVVPANNREKVVFAFDHLEADLRQGAVFLLDCDGAVESRLKGHADLIISSNRDIESDLILELAAFERSGYEYFHGETAEDADQKALGALELACHISALVGAVVEGARRTGVRTRIPDAVTRQKRLLRPSDLDGLRELIIASREVTFPRVLSQVARALQWTEGDSELVRGSCEEASAKTCRTHSKAACRGCFHRSFCMGHQLVDALAIAISIHSGSAVSSDELDRMIRVGAKERLLDGWTVARRIRGWEELTGRKVLGSVSE